MLTTLMIGNKIAEARKKINISQAQLAERLFISSQAVGKWERGESMPDIITFNRLAEILGVDLNYFTDSFKSATNEIAPVESLVKQPAELPTENQNPPAGKAGKKAGWNMSQGNWVNADFSGLKNLHDKFSASNMKSCRFIGSDLSGLLLKGNNIENCDFSRSDIRGSRIQSSYLAVSLLKECSLKETEFSESYINGCDFSGAGLEGAAFKSGGFQNNKVTDAVLKGTSFNAMHLLDVTFNGTIEDCYFENCTFKKVTFRNSTIINTFFKNKSLKGIRFIECQADRMTFEFLKNGKADLTGITLLT
jgi:uncharacterized protein YjbI with pentapeptide repeats